MSAFNCGKDPLDRWLRDHALRNEGRASRTYVVTDPQNAVSGRLIAYYTLAAGSVLMAELPRKLRHNLPNPVPVLLLGRLAVDLEFAGRGLGAFLLREALLRTAEASRSVGLRMLIVHPLDDDSVSFYRKYGFQEFPQPGAGNLTMHLAIETILAALST